MITDSSNPYVGLRPFDTEESLLFFGRNDQTLELLQRLHQHHFVAVVGSSGSGKSSLLRAGLIPALKAGYLVEDSDHWAIAIMKPGHSPIFNLAKSLLKQVESHVTNEDIGNFANRIENEGVDAILEVIRPYRLDKKANFFLLVDQFEELFRFSMEQKNVSKKDEAIDFVNIILELTEQNVIPFYVVLTMRSDFIGDCSNFFGLPEAMNKSQYLVPRLNRQQLKMVIEGPAKLFGTKIDRSLTSHILNELSNFKDELPLLQHVLMRIYQHKMEVDENGTLDRNDYQHVGGLQKALSNHADEALSDMTEDQRLISKEIFKALTAIDENGRKIRRPVLLSELKQLSGQNEKDLLQIINRFIDDSRSFLVITETGNSNDKSIDISHESLIRQWHTLGEWVDEEADAATYYLQLARATELYKSEKRDLLSGVELQLALDWRKKFKPSALWANRYKEGFEDSMSYLSQSEDLWIFQQAKESKRKKENILKKAVIGLLTILVVGAGGATLYIIDQNKELNSRDEAFRLHFAALELVKEDATKALRLEEEAIKTYDFISFKNSAKDIYNKYSFYKIITDDTNLNGLAIFSPNTKHILTGSQDSIARLYDLDGKIINEFVGHSGSITAIGFSEDGTKIITGSSDKTARLWNTQGEFIQEFIGHTDTVTSVDISKDGERLLTGSKDSSAVAWSLDGNKLQVYKGDSGAITSVSYSPDASKLVTGSEDAFARLWSSDGNMIMKYEHASEIWSVDFSPEGDKFVAGSEDATAGLYNMEGDTLRKYVLHSDAIKAVSFSKDGRSLLTASRDRSAMLWTTVGNLIQEFVGNELPITSVSFSPEENQILTASLNEDKDNPLSDVRIWDIKSKVLEFEAHDHMVKSAKFSPDSTMILTGSHDDTAKLWSLEGDLIQTFKGHENGIQCVAFSPDGNYIITGSMDKTAKLWNLNGKVLQTFSGHTSNVDDVLFGKDGNSVYTSSFDGSIRKYDLKGNQLSIVSGRPFGAIWHLDFSQELDQLLVGCEDGTTRLFNADLNLIRQYEKHTDGIGIALFSPDSKKILIGSEDKEVSLWDINGTLLHVFNELEEPVFNVAFSPDGQNIAIADDGNNIKFYKIDGTFSHGFKLTGDLQYVNTMSYSQDSNYLLMGINTVDSYFLWNVEPLQPLTNFLKKGNLQPLSKEQKEYFEIED